MKLYATTTSERASKGQGGNEFLEIVITDKDKNTIIKLLIIPDEYIFRASLKTSDKVYLDKIGDIKGKSQKGEKSYCEIPTLNGFETREI